MAILLLSKLLCQRRIFLLHTCLQQEDKPLMVPAWQQYRPGAAGNPHPIVYTIYLSVVTKGYFPPSPLEPSPVRPRGGGSSGVCHYHYAPVHMHGMMYTRNPNCLWLSVVCI